MSPERALWQAVLLRAVTDATAVDPAGDDSRRAKQDAIRWLTLGGRDFREVCSNAGMDPDFIQDAFLGGRIDPALLRASEETKQRNGKAT
jgi:hypothetical protein